ncbi:hypothetical protein WAB17_01745 [Parerythrobacter aurantius]|uniref:hypothetical protein n=1 Tax=Parerythrobacter aurantius TaxID=3127706 RepID=UPI0032568E48
MNPLPQLLRPSAAEAKPASPAVPQGEGAQRLQVGLIGLGAMVLLVGVADMIMTRAQLAERVSVPEAAATTEPADMPTSEGAALEAAGVVPDLPKDASAEPVPTGPVLPAQGEPRQ